MKGKTEIPKLSKVSVNSVAIFTKEVYDIKASLSSLTSIMQGIQETLAKILQLSKDCNIDLGKLCMDVDELKKEGVCSVNELIKKVDSLNMIVNSSNNDLVVSLQNAYC